MRKGQLNRALVLEDRVSVSDGAGGIRIQWNALGTLWAAIDAGSGREAGELGVQRSAVQLRIVVRSAPVGSSMRPRPEQRLREGDRLYRIEAVAEDDPRGLYLTCYAKEEVVT